jgi:hypothetical protein
MAGVAAGAGYAASKFGDFISVSDNAARSQVASNNYTPPTTTPAPATNQPVVVNVKNYTLMDGQNIAANTFKNAQSSPSMDNGTGLYDTTTNYSISPQ